MSKETIMVVDDEKEIRELIAIYLKMRDIGSCKLKMEKKG